MHFPTVPTRATGGTKRLPRESSTAVKNYSFFVVSSVQKKDVIKGGEKERIFLPCNECCVAAHRRRLLLLLHSVKILRDVYCVHLNEQIS